MRYVFPDGINLGFHENATGKWFLVYKDKEIEHAISHWRYLPPAHENAPPAYEELKEQVESLKNQLK